MGEREQTAAWQIRQGAKGGANNGTWYEDRQAEVAWWVRKGNAREKRQREGRWEREPSRKGLRKGKQKDIAWCCPATQLFGGLAGSDKGEELNAVSMPVRCEREMHAGCCGRIN